VTAVGAAFECGVANPSATVKRPTIPAITTIAARAGCVFLAVKNFRAFKDFLIA
jgi:hypothetical protein